MSFTDKKKNMSHSQNTSNPKQKSNKKEAVEERWVHLHDSARCRELFRTARLVTNLAELLLVQKSPPEALASAAAEEQKSPPEALASAADTVVQKSPPEALGSNVVPTATTTTSSVTSMKQVEISGKKAAILFFFFLFYNKQMEGGGHIGNAKLCPNV
jgi:hypothetical protein